MRLYNEDNSPRNIRCYEAKSGKYADRYCVVYTRLNFAPGNYEYGDVFYVAMSADPFHPLGIGMHGEAKRWNFKPCGTPIKFEELPPKCQELVLDDYLAIWFPDEWDKQEAERNPQHKKYLEGVTA